MNDQPTEVTREELLEQLGQQAEHVFDPASAPTVIHRWIDRGLKYSCENAGHAHHEAWKRIQPMQQ